MLRGLSALALSLTLALAGAGLVAPAPAQAAVGMVVGMGLSYDKLDACGKAMTDAHAKATIDAMGSSGGAANLHIVSSDCQCEEDPAAPPGLHWKCMAVTHWSNE